jgi:hypothetical protein
VVTGVGEGAGITVVCAGLFSRGRALGVVVVSHVILRKAGLWYIARVVCLMVGAIVRVVRCGVGGRWWSMARTYSTVVATDIAVSALRLSRQSLPGLVPWENRTW